MPIPEMLTGIGVKIAGSIFGSIIAVMFIKPRSRAELWTRLAVSIPVGTLFSWLPPQIFDFPANVQGMLSAAFVSGFAAWWLLGSFVRIAENFNGNKKS